jgi:hypothetical protein
MHPGQSTYATQNNALSLLSVLARFGIVRLLARPLGMVAQDPPNEDALFSRSVRPQSLQTFADEIQGIPDSLSQAGAVKSFGDIPLIVLSRGLDQDSDWQAGQAELLQLSTNSQQLVAEKSGHNIELDQPEAAVGAIVKMVHHSKAANEFNPIQLISIVQRMEN